MDGISISLAKWEMGGKSTCRAFGREKRAEMARKMFCEYFCNIVHRTVLPPPQLVAVLVVVMWMLVTDVIIVSSIK